MAETPEDPMMPNVNDSAHRQFLKGLWREADARYASMVGDQSLPVSVRWKEMQDRDREERYFELMKKATFRGTILAHLLLVLIGAALWIAFVALATR